MLYSGVPVEEFPAPVASDSRILNPCRAILKTEKSISSVSLTTNGVKEENAAQHTVLHKNP